jgi:hypothetical protein
MRHPCVLALSALLTVACTRAERAAQETTPTAANVAVGGFSIPESVLYDSVADVYLVSNINGNPTDRDDNGFISRLSPSGTITTLKWIDGAAEQTTLNAPKGMALRHDTLFVADIDAVRMFDRRSGAPLGDWPVEGAAFLNDLAVGPDGTLYVTDTGVEPGEGGLVANGKDGIYKREGDRWVAILSGKGLGNPNGILAEAKGLTVVTFVSGEIYTVDPATGARTMLPKPPQGGLDGVARLPNGDLLVTSWAGRGVYRLADTTFTMVAENIASPADIGLDLKRGALMIPDFVADTVFIRPIR